LLPCIFFEKYIYILALEMASPGNQHCANCIGTLSFPTLYRRYLADLKTKSRLLGGAEFRDSTRPSVAGCGLRSSNTSQRARQVLASRQGDVVSLVSQCNRLLAIQLLAPIARRREECPANDSPKSHHSLAAEKNAGNKLT